jgi:hypothetical protein
MRIRKVVHSSAWLLTLVLLVPAVGAEDDPPLIPGQRLRVTAMAPGRFSGVTVGSLMNVGPDSLTLLDTERNSVMELPLGAISRLEVSQGRRRQTRKGLLLGGAIGLAAAPFVWLALSECGQQGGSSADCPVGVTSGDKVSAAMGMFAGATVLGAWVGYRTERELWLDSSTERLRLRVRRERGGGRVALSFSF